MYKIIHCVVFVLLLAFTSGCSTTKAYKKENPNPSAVSTLEISLGSGQYVQQINDVRPRWRWSKAILVPAGQNLILVNYDPMDDRVAQSASIGGGGLVGELIAPMFFKDYKWKVIFNAVQGRQYEFFVSPSKSGKPKDVIPAVADIETWKIVSKSYRLN